MLHDLILLSIQPSDCQPISDAFAQLGWNKPLSLNEQYVKLQETGERDIILDCFPFDWCRLYGEDR